MDKKPTELETRVIALVSRVLEVEQETLGRETRLEEDLGTDSLDQAELLMEVEEAFSVQVPDDIQSRLKSIGDIVEYLDAADQQVA